MVLATTEGLIGLVPTIVTAQLVRDLVTGRKPKKRRRSKRTKRRKR